MPASNLHAQVPTASGLTALAHYSLCVSFVGLGLIPAPAKKSLAHSEKLTFLYR
jgi:hypothetical protein